MLRATVIFALLAALILIPSGANAQDRGLTKDEIIEANFSGPVYLDSYWTSGSLSNQSGEEVNVGPGDGASTLAVVLINRGLSDIAGITGRLSLPEGFQATGKGAGAAAVASFNQIAAVGNTFVLFFDVDILDTAAVGEYSARMQLDYSKFFETGSPRNVEIIVPFRVAGEAILVVNRVPTDENGSNTQIAGGKIEDYVFTLANKGTAHITNVVITIESPSESMQILGDSKWNIRGIDAGSQVNLATRVFAANSLIGNPALFDVTVEYSSNGQSSSETFALGTYVAGDISVTAYDIEINSIGGTPNIVGNLLNEGNTLALFTTIEVVSAENLVSSLPPKQYLGDLEENSPLPFSIPIDVDSRVGADSYPVSLKITYKDNLRQLHTFDINTEVRFMPEQPTVESAQNDSMSTLPIGIGAAAAVAIAAVTISRRRKKTALKRTIQASKQDDMESVLNSHNKQDDRK